MSVWLDEYQARRASTGEAADWQCRSCNTSYTQDMTECLMSVFSPFNDALIWFWLGASLIEACQVLFVRFARSVPFVFFIFLPVHSSRTSSSHHEICTVASRHCLRGGPQIETLRIPSLTCDDTGKIDTTCGGSAEDCPFGSRTQGSVGWRWRRVVHGSRNEGFDCKHKSDINHRKRQHIRLMPNFSFACTNYLRTLGQRSFESMEVFVYQYTGNINVWSWSLSV